MQQLTNTLEDIEIKADNITFEELLENYLLDNIEELLLYIGDGKYDCSRKN